jgi:Holliday junction DNA helicase RuvA
MYAFISGQVVSVEDGKIVLENNGIGYLLNVSQNTLKKAGNLNASLQLYTYLHVKEDVFALYGFWALEEKRLFENLISISGIGPKLAMQVLSGYDLETLAVAIASGDAAKLSKIKGLGKKTAERIILELKEIYKHSAAGEAPPSAGEALPSDLSDAVFALVSLGLSKSQAEKAVREAAKNVSGIENIIAYALRNL